MSSPAGAERVLGGKRREVPCIVARALVERHSSGRSAPSRTHLSPRSFYSLSSKCTLLRTNDAARSKQQLDAGQRERNIMAEGVTGLSRPRTTTATRTRMHTPYKHTTNITQHATQSHNHHYITIITSQHTQALFVDQFREKAMPDVLSSLDALLATREWLEEGRFTVSDVAVGVRLLPGLAATAAATAATQGACLAARLPPPAAACRLATAARPPARLLQQTLTADCTRIYTATRYTQQQHTHTTHTSSKQQRICNNTNKHHHHHRHKKTVVPALRDVHARRQGLLRAVPSRQRVRRAPARAAGVPGCAARARACASRSACMPSNCAAEVFSVAGDGVERGGGDMMLSRFYN